MGRHAEAVADGLVMVMVMGYGLDGQVPGATVVLLWSGDTKAIGSAIYLASVSVRLGSPGSGVAGKDVDRLWSRACRERRNHASACAGIQVSCMGSEWERASARRCVDGMTCSHRSCFE